MPTGRFKILITSEELSERISMFVKEHPESAQNDAQAIYNAWSSYEEARGINNRRVVEIAGKKIGIGFPVYFIAEIGINHNGSIELAKKLIDMAVEASCDAVKFQKRTINKVYAPEELAKPRESPFGKTNGDLKRALEFGEEGYGEIDRYCKEKGIVWFASPWDTESVDFLEKFDTPCHKVASAKLTDRGLLEKIKATGKPVILSTGMSTMGEIEKAVALLGEENLVLMHCTSTYPSSDSELDLNVIRTLKERFGCPVGYSGHETGVQPTLTAIAIGAEVAERHITLDRAMYGSDQAASLERRGLEIILRDGKAIRDYLGQFEKRVHDSEVPIAKKLRTITTL